MKVGQLVLTFNYSADPKTDIPVIRSRQEGTASCGSLTYMSKYWFAADSAAEMSISFMAVKTMVMLQANIGGLVVIMRAAKT